MHDHDDPDRGCFIALDGPDGGGKTTQVARLVSWLESLGKEVVACRDPGGTGLGDRLRSIVLDRSELQIGIRAETLLYMASRAQLVEQTIRPAIEKGWFVVSDRYLLANVVYQGYAGGVAVDDVWQVGRVATGGLMPDLTLLLDVPPQVAQTRVGAPRDRIEDRPESFRAAVRSGFLEAAATYPAPIVVIDASADADIVTARIQSEVTRVLGIRSRP
jgi:dTMP kinase